VTHQCDGIQGYICSPAVPADRIQSQLQSFGVALKSNTLADGSNHSSKQRA
jgi:hypothetical protein